MESLSILKKSWRLIGIILIPLALSPLFLGTEGEDITGKKTTKWPMIFCMALMALYWMFEVIPIPITALLPLLLFPLLGIQDIYKVSENYSKESNMIFLTGIIIALALEYCNLHHRIALFVMTLVGGSSVILLLAVMFVASFFAMWLSATTCVALLLPTVVAIIDEVNDSPEVMTNSEARRKSHRASSLGLEAGSFVNGSRKSSNTSVNPESVNYGRISTFANVGLTRNVKKQESTSALPLRKTSLRPNIYTLNRNNSGNSPRNSLVSNNSGALSPQPRLNRIVTHNTDANEDQYRPPVPSSLTFKDNPVEITIEPPTPDDCKDRRVSFNERLSVNLDLNDEECLDKTESEIAEENEVKENMKTMFLLAIAYGANIGGTAVITGAGPNKVFKEVIKPLDISQGGEYTDITFFMWMAFNIPPTIVNLLIAWAYLIIRFQGITALKHSLSAKHKETVAYKWKSREVDIYLRREYDKLGTITYHECGVAFCFILVILCWILRDPELFSGWGDIKTGAKSGDSTGAMVGVVLLFIIPKCWKFLSPNNKDAQYEPLLDWSFVAKKLPWSVLLVLGSGFAIADAFAYSGLSEELVERLKTLEAISHKLLLLYVILIVCFTTELVSNTACASIILPIMISVSISLNIHPLYLTVAAAVACSYAFMSPVGSPTNAMVYAAGNFGALTMARIGFLLNLICIGVLFCNTILLGPFLFDDFEYKYPNMTGNDPDYDPHVQ